MKIPKIANALGMLDYDLVNAAICEKKNKKTWFKWEAIAASFVVMLSMIVLILNHTLTEGPGSETKLEKYYKYEINAGEFSEYVGGNVIDADRIGNKIENVIVTAGWKNESGEWLSLEYLNAEVYEIEGVKRDVSVALKFIDQGEAVTTTHYYEIKHPNAEYNGMTLPDYKSENPVRYLEESSMGKANGWQDFGVHGEIQTISVPLGSSYVYQMYAYYIRNDLSHIYSEQHLPDTLKELPQWLTDTCAPQRRAFWYSMGNRIPKWISLTSTTEIISENGEMSFIKAEYKIQMDNTDKEECWVVYFMEEDGIYSAYAALANENYDFVTSYTEAIVKSYQEKQK